jgi:hypothetical protein
MNDVILFRSTVLIDCSLSVPFEIKGWGIIATFTTLTLRLQFV